MKLYRCLINSTAGLVSDPPHQRDPNLEQTKQLLERGIIAEVKIEQPEEVKATPRKRKAKE